MPVYDTIRTDVAGSLLRPAEWGVALVALEKVENDADVFRKIEDEAIVAAVRLQEAVGLDVVTDGEYRRLNFQDSFGLAVEGFDAVQAKLLAHEQRVARAEPLRRRDIPNR
jgi:5-methyltetrahydropteroyltriglutamate--homocysteine methyltransferase